MFRTRRHAFAVTYTLLVVIGFVALWRNWNSLERWVWDRYERWQFTEQLTGGAKALAEGQFKAGDSVEDLLAAYPSHFVIRSGVYTTVRYPIGYDRSLGRHAYSAGVIAKNGRLVEANVSNPYGHKGPNWDLFEMSPDERAQWHAETRAAITNRQHAIIGPAAYAPLNELQRK